MSREIIFTFIVSSVILGVIPGPSVCFSIAHSIRYGTVKTFPSIFGQLIANTIQIFLVFLGINSLLEQSLTLFSMVKLMGALYLFYLGIKQWGAGMPILGIDVQLKSRNIYRSFMDGFIVCGTNPKAIIFYAAYFPQFINDSSAKIIQFIVLGTLSLFVCGSVLTFYTLLAGKTRDWFLRKGYWQTQNRITGSLMMMAGFFLAFTGKK